MREGKTRKSVKEEKTKIYINGGGGEKIMQKGQISIIGNKNNKAEKTKNANKEGIMDVT